LTFGLRKGGSKEKGMDRFQRRERRRTASVEREKTALPWPTGNIFVERERMGKKRPFSRKKKKTCRSSSTSEGLLLRHRECTSKKETLATLRQKTSWEKGRRRAVVSSPRKEGTRSSIFAAHLRQEHVRNIGRGN